MRLHHVLVALVAALNVSDVASAGPPPRKTPDDFNFAMYGALKSHKGNLFFSAPSMRQALGMAYLGARGATAAEMSSALSLNHDAAASAAEAKGEIQAFKTASGSASLAIANRLWVDKGYALDAEFTKNAGRADRADAVDFTGHPTEARQRINAWVLKETNDKISDLLPEGSVTSSTKLVVTNAIWFKGTWAKPFEKTATRSEPFFADGAAPVDVPMMHKTSTFEVGEAPGAKILEMRYEKSDLAMDVIVPDAATGIAAIEDELALSGTGQLATWTSSLRTKYVAVSFPKLTFTWSGSVTEPLRQLGMKRAFDARTADFRGIASPGTAAENLYVSDVVHKAFIAIDEQGTEAAAATGIVMAPSAVMAPAFAFKVDHPFVFVIRDVKDSRILFMGRVTNPKT
jgi:serpin B